MFYSELVSINIKQGHFFVAQFFLGHPVQIEICVAVWLKWGAFCNANPAKWNTDHKYNTPGGDKITFYFVCLFVCSSGCLQYMSGSPGLSTHFISADWKYSWNHEVFVKKVRLSSTDQTDD